MPGNSSFSPTDCVDLGRKVMSGRHRTRSSKSNVVIGSIAASVGVSSVLSAAIVELVSPEPSTVADQPAPQTAQEQPLAQEGTLVGHHRRMSRHFTPK